MTVANESPATHNPGSHAAKRDGCICSGAINQWGRGAFVSGGGAVQYITHPKCALHSVDEVIRRGKELGIIPADV